MLAVQWSAAPISARDMLNVLRFREMLGGGLTAESYGAMLDLIASRSGHPIEIIAAQPVDDIMELGKACMESVANIMNSNSILRKAFE